MTTATAVPVAPLPVTRGTGRSTTRRTMLRLLAGLLLATCAVFATSLAEFTRTYDTAETVRARTTPAVEGILAARAALVHADQAAVTSFGVGAALSGVGEDFQVQLAIASQSLTRVAEENVAGAAGINRLQLIGGLLVTYTGLIGRADANLRQTGGDLLGVADLFSASRLLHKTDSGILAQLDSLLTKQQAALDRQLAASDTTAATIVVLLLPVVVLGVGLAVTHEFFRRRFRRRLNPALAVAAVLLITLTWVATRPMSAQQNLTDSRGVLYGLVDQERSRLADHDQQGQWALRQLLANDGCDNGGCGATTDEFFEKTREPHAAPNSRGEAELAQDTAAVAQDNNAANADAGLVILIYVLTILVVAAIAVAFQPRLREYRYRS